jgi:DNA polymerase IV
MPGMRKIIHIDMDAFYASVEQRDNPGLKGKPVIVGGDPGRRGVVAACSYEARRFGIHSAMASSQARKLCPGAVFLPPRFDVYQEVSSQVMGIFHEHTDLVEPLSLDEAFLDVTENRKGIALATKIAQLIRAEIRTRTGLTASAGVSYNKFLAKAASDFRKPDGITVVTPEQARAFIDGLAIGKFHGVGRVTEERMRSLGILTGADLLRYSEAELVSLFGKIGSYFHSIATGVDTRPVTSLRIRKSLGREITLEEDINDPDQMKVIIAELAEDVGEMLGEKRLKARTVTLKLKYSDFQSITRSITLEHMIDSGEEILRHAGYLLKETEAGPRKVRLLGVTVSGFDAPEHKPRKPGQLILPIFGNDLVP